MAVKPCASKTMAASSIRRHRITSLSYRVATIALACALVYVAAAATFGATSAKATTWWLETPTLSCMSFMRQTAPFSSDAGGDVATKRPTGPDLPPPLVFVHVGDDPNHFPPYLGDALRQAARWNPRLRMYVVLSQRFLNGSESPVAQLLSSPYPEDAAYWQERLQAVPLEEVSTSPRRARFMNVSTLDTGFRSGFWKYTTERLFVLAEALEHLGIDEAFHMENDNMLYARLGDLALAMRRLYPRLACTYIGGGQATAGFLYVHERKALDRFLDFVLESPGLNDMQTLWEYAERYGRDHLAFLPADPVPTEHTAMAEVRALGGVFDGAPHGQLLGGTDNGHPPGFVNPPSGVGGYEYGWDVDEATGLRRPYVAPKKDNDGKKDDNGGGRWPIFNLHIHCKQLHRFAS